MTKKNDMDALRTMPAFSPEKPWVETTAALAPIVDAAFKELRELEPRRKYLGASMLGAECTRAVAYEWHQQPRDSGRVPSGRAHRIFDAGHVLEDRMAEYLRIAGFDLRTHGKDGQQFGYSVAGGKIQGHIDGVFVGGPSIPGIGFVYPALWENKAINSKAFAKLVDDGLRVSKPLYFNQVQILMAYMELERCLFTAINKDTSEVFYELVSLDVATAQWLSDRAVNVVRSNNADEFPRIGRDETDWRCRFCDFHDLCWGVGERATPKPQQSAPNWLQPTPPKEK